MPMSLSITNRSALGASPMAKGLGTLVKAGSPGERVGMTCMGSWAAVGKLRGALMPWPHPCPAESAEEAVRVV